MGLGCIVVFLLILGFFISGWEALFCGVKQSCTRQYADCFRAAACLAVVCAIWCLIYLLSATNAQEAVLYLTGAALLITAAIGWGRIATVSDEKRRRMHERMAAVRAAGARKRAAKQAAKEQAQAAAQERRDREAGG